MSMKDGGSAFPRMEVSEEWSEDKAAYVKVRYLSDGMSLRDYFATAALRGQITFEGMEGCDPEHIAAMAYFVADAMLAAREKQS